MKTQPDNFSFGPSATGENSDEIGKAKSKLILDFGLEQPKLERVTLEVLKQFIKEKPARMSQVIRQWMRPGGGY